MIKKELIEHYYLPKDLNKLTLKEKEIYVNELFKKEYVGKEITYFLNEKEIKALITTKTRNNFLIRKHRGKINENKKEYAIKINLAYKNKYLDLLKNSKFIFKGNDYKSYYNRNHNKQTFWLYFKKSIYINNDLFVAIIDIQNKNNKYIIYNLKIKEASETATLRHHK